jgi:signal transduction histidine kinase
MPSVHELSGQALTRLALALSQAEDLDSVLWAVAREAIARLALEDCVVYLVDAERGVCVQRAAYGPKNPQGFEIHAPIEIPLGAGIVGHVAATGAHVRIDDTAADPRYIVDDAARSSELAVPIVHQGRVIGVLDSEHSAAGFFTQHHVEVFEAIVSLAANRIAAAVLAQELAVARDAAEAAVRSKQDFLRMMSHELRTPLHGILGLGELLRDDLADDGARETLSLMLRSADALAQILTDALTIADLGLERVQFERVPFSPEALTRAVADLFAIDVRGRGLTLRVEVSPTAPAAIAGDPARVRQVLLALLSNAVRFTRAGGVVVRLDGDGGALRVAVEDTGVGIPPDRLDRVWEPFVQAEGGTRRPYDGAGLGLSVARGLVARMGGAIELRSEVGVGTTAELTLPVAPGAAG